MLLADKKVAGILLESSGAGPRVAWLAIGIGVNLVEAPAAERLPEGAVPATRLADHLGGPLAASGRPPDPEALLAVLAASMERIGQVWRDQGFDRLRALWLSRAARLGETIVARLPGETVRGTFETVDGAGHLVLRTAEGTRRIAAADVYFG